MKRTSITMVAIVGLMLTIGLPPAATADDHKYEATEPTTEEAWVEDGQGGTTLVKTSVWWECNSEDCRAFGKHYAYVPAKGSIFVDSGIADDTCDLPDVQRTPLTPDECPTFSDFYDLGQCWTATAWTRVVASGQGVSAVQQIGC